MAWKLEIAADNDATSWTDITASVDWTTMRFGGTANRGEIDTGSGFDWADDAAAVTIPKRRRVRLIEDATTPDTTLWQGRTVGDEIARGTRFEGNARQFDVQLVDVNADFGGVDTLNNHRDAETDIVRLQNFFDVYWGSGQTRPSTVFGDTYVSAASPVNLVKHTYTAVQFIELMTHITDTSGKQFFLTRDYDLFYAPVTSTIYAAGLSITDDGTANGTTSFAPGDAVATVDATEMFSGVRVRYSNNRVKRVVRAAVETNNDQWRTGIVDESITSSTAATTRANRFLDEFDHERISYRCWIDLLDSQVHLLSWGMTVSYRSAASGLTSPATLRVSRLSWERIANATTDARWRAHLELNYPTKFGRASSGGGSGNPATPPATAPPPFIPGQDAALIDVVLSVGSVSGRAIHYASQVGASLPTAVPGNEYRLVFDQTSDFSLPGGNYSFMDGANFDIWETAEGPTRADDWSPDNIYPYMADAPYTPGKHWETGWRAWTGAAVAFDIAIGGTMISGFYGGLWEGRLQLQMRVPGGGASDPGDDPIGYPSAGQPVIDTVGSDGTASPGSPTAYAYAPLSLVILVNGVDMAAALTETDPDAGTYELLNPVPEGAEVTRRYLGTGTGLL